MDEHMAAGVASSIIGGFFQLAGVIVGLRIALGRWPWEGR